MSQNNHNNKRIRLDESLTKYYWYKLTGQYNKLPKIDINKINKYINNNESKR